MRMEERGILESDVQGRYRIKPVPSKKRGNKWVAPDIAKILQESGVAVDAAGDGRNRHRRVLRRIVASRRRAG